MTRTAVDLHLRVGPSGFDMPAQDRIDGSGVSSGGLAGGVLLMGGDSGALGAAPAASAVKGSRCGFLRGQTGSQASAYCTTVPRWPGAEAPNALDWLEDYARRAGTRGWVIIPAGDSEVRLVTNNHARLSELFRLTTPPWAVT